MRIAHVSDIHMSSPHYIPEWGDRLRKVINSIEADLLIITGDLTDNGYPHEYDIVKEFLDSLDAAERIILPGNHDARNLGFEIFEDIFGSRFPIFENEEVIVFGMDSTEPDIDDGHIGRENYDRIRRVFSEKDKFKIFCIHHHLIPIPGTGRERHIPVDAGEALALCTELRIDMVLSGHKHLPWVWRLENTYYITAGTATTRRLKGRSHPSFNIIDMDGSGVRVREFNVASGEIRESLRA